MLEDYFNIITNIENFIDGLMIIDEMGIIRYHQYPSGYYGLLGEKSFIGRRVLDVFENLTEESSTLMRALHYGETVKNKVQHLKFPSAVEYDVLDSTFPLKEGGRIIGAVSISIFMGDIKKTDFIDLPHMTRYVHDLWLPSDIIGSSEVIKKLKHKIYQVSKTNSSILIYGETGSGKDLVAQSIHATSSRKDKRFISQNCAAIPDTLLESIFFGTTKGAYTGAENRAGIFEQADGGTIFLDEINSMNMSMQAKLLRAIEDKKVTRIGAVRDTRVDVRIIAALNEPPQKCMQERRIRPDLFYRLSSIQLKVPSLQERLEDIPELTQHFIGLYNQEMGRHILGVTDEVLQLFYHYGWPGNVREFKNVIEGGFNFSTGDYITKEDIPDYISMEDTGQEAFFTSLTDAVENYEKSYIIQKVPQAQSFTQLANILGISRQTLNYKLKKYQIGTDWQ